MSCSGDEEKYNSMVVHGTAYRIKRSCAVDSAVVDKIVEWMKDMRCVYGETLMQDDDTVIYAPNLLAEIIDDILQPEEMP